jgi:hypothetical protein
VPCDVARSAVVGLIVGSVVAYSAIAAYQQRWASTVAAAVVAVLLGSFHRRARFAAYIFFTALGLRGALTGMWALPLYGGILLAAMQTPAARRAWPRLVPGRLRGGDDRMRRS